MQMKYPEIGICGLSCRLCPRYQSSFPGRCGGCKIGSRMTAGCPFITCALKRKGVEFCWECGESESCRRWRRHREASREHDSFKCYQKLEEDIEYVQTNGVEAFDGLQKAREALLLRLLGGFNEGRSKSYYCIAATVMDINELEDALAEAEAGTKSMGLKDKARMMHAILDASASRKGYRLSLRK
jgi:hypothetical protein